MCSGISRDSWTSVFSESQLPPFKEGGSGSRLSARVPLNAAAAPAPCHLTPVSNQNISASERSRLLKRS